MLDQAVPADESIVEKSLEHPELVYLEQYLS